MLRSLIFPPLASQRLAAKLIYSKEEYRRCFFGISDQFQKSVCVSSQDTHTHTHSLSLSLNIKKLAMIKVPKELFYILNYGSSYLSKLIELYTKRMNFYYT